MSETISVPWPRIPLTPEQWRRRVEDLAEAAEAMVGRRTTLQQQAQLATWWLGLCWSGFGAETIAASCRASLLLDHSVVMAAGPADQLAEIHESLDEIWAAAQEDPSAAVATVSVPVLDLPPRDRGGRRPGPKPAAAAVEPEPLPSPAPAPAPPEPAAAAAEPSADPDPDELPPEWQQPLEPAPSPASKPLRDRSLRMAARPEPPAPPDPDPEPLPSPAAPVPDVLEPEVLEPPEGFSSAPQLALELGVQATTIGAWAVRNLAEDDVFRHGRRVWFRHSSVVGVYVPRSERPLKASPPRPLPPVGWFHTAEAAELLDVAPGTLGRWRMAGRLGVEGVGWCRVLGLFYYSPAGVEGAQGCDLDSLIDEIRAEQ